jgi:hypothetical protein
MYYFPNMNFNLILPAFIVVFLCQSYHPEDGLIASRNMLVEI